MAKSKFVGTGRRSQTTPKPEVELTREEQVKHLCALGMPNEAIWGALEAQYPQIIKDDAERRRKAGKVINYDAAARKAIGEQLRSVKGLQ